MPTQPLLVINWQDLLRGFGSVGQKLESIAYMVVALFCFTFCLFFLSLSWPCWSRSLHRTRGVLWQCSSWEFEWKASFWRRAGRTKCQVHSTRLQLVEVRNVRAQVEGMAVVSKKTISEEKTSLGQRWREKLFLLLLWFAAICFSLHQTFPPYLDLDSKQFFPIRNGYSLVYQGSEFRDSHEWPKTPAASSPTLALIIVVHTESPKDSRPHSKTKGLRKTTWKVIDRSKCPSPTA